MSEDRGSFGEALATAAGHQPRPLVTSTHSGTELGLECNFSPLFPIKGDSWGAGEERWGQCLFLLLSHS